MQLSQIAAIIERCQPYDLAEIRRAPLTDHITATLVGETPAGQHRISFAVGPFELDPGHHADTFIELRARDAAEELANHLAKLKAA